MGFFSRLFGRDTIKLEDVKPEKEQKTPFVSAQEEREVKKCVPKKESASTSPFLEECEPENKEHNQ